MGSIVDVLRLFASYTQETNYTVWESLVANLSSINRLLQYTDFHDSFKKFAVKLFTPTVVRLGWNSKDTDCKGSYILQLFRDSLHLLIEFVVKFNRTSVEFQGEIVETLLKCKAISETFYSMSNFIFTIWIILLPLFTHTHTHTHTHTYTHPKHSYSGHHAS